MSTSTSTSGSGDWNQITENGQKTLNSTKRKHDAEPDNLAHKKPKEMAREPINKHSTLENQLKLVKQHLEAENNKTRALEKKVDVLIKERCATGQLELISKNYHI